MPYLAFVLTHALPRLDPVAVARAHADLAPQAPALEPVLVEGEDPSQRGSTLRFGDGVGALVVVPAPHAIPTGEVERGAGFSVARLRPGASRFPRHGAHLTVVLSGLPDRPAAPALVRLTWGVAAVAKSVKALGVYWGNGQVTHETSFFLDGARGLSTDAVPLPLWTGVSLARQGDRVSILSLGIMQQFGLPDLRLTTRQGRGNEGLGVFFDLLAYLVRRGEALPDGDTVGRTTDERLPVRYEPSPVAQGQQVWRVDLPG